MDNKRMLSLQDDGGRGFSAQLSNASSIGGIVPASTYNNSRQWGLNSYPCPFCRKNTFRQMSDLKRHIRIHTGEKPYKCPYCDYSAAQKTPVKTHVLRKHPDALPMFT